MSELRILEWEPGGWACVERIELGQVPRKSDLEYAVLFIDLEPCGEAKGTKAMRGLLTSSHLRGRERDCPIGGRSARRG